MSGFIGMMAIGLIGLSGYLLAKMEDGNYRQGLRVFLCFVIGMICASNTIDTVKEITKARVLEQHCEK